VPSLSGKGCWASVPMEVWRALRTGRSPGKLASGGQGSLKMGKLPGVLFSTLASHRIIKRDSEKYPCSVPLHGFCFGWASMSS
jgi:hypothetical protein